MKSNSSVIQQKKNLFPGAEALLRGNPNEMNDDLSLDDQIEILPYDRRWEFPRNRLKLGNSSHDNSPITLSLSI
jgi:hypothetical protein